MRRLLIFLVIYAVAIYVSAREEERVIVRPVTSAFTVGIGTASIRDTYLTPLRYHGSTFKLDYERWQAMKFDARRWMMRLNVNLEYSRTKNPAGNAVMHSIGLHPSWSMIRRWEIPVAHGTLRYGAGGVAMADIGVRYLMRNGNNPVSIEGAAAIGVTGIATYSFQLSRLPLVARYQPVIPVIGAFFAPEYGELYYEIYLGNRHGLAHAAWFGSRFVMDNLVTVDLRFGATALRLGYSGRILSSKTNNIVTRNFTHLFMVGVSGEWLSINPHRNNTADVAKINAYY